MEPLPGISHEDLLKLVLAIALLLGTARVFGELARRVGQPAVVGELLAGVVLGPSMLSGLFPGLGELFLPDTAIQSQLLDVVGLLGVMFLLIVVGLETDLVLVRARFRAAAAVGLGGLVLPLILGVALSLVMPASLLTSGDRLTFGLFLAVSMALSAIPVLAKILADLGLLRREFGQTALAAGMIDDVVGWALLGFVTSLAAAGGVSVSALLTTIAAVVVFFAATALIARPLAEMGMTLVEERTRSRDMALSLVVAFAFGWGAFSHWLHLEPILGAFAIGVVFGQMRRLPVEVARRLEAITFGVLAPIFLATAGLRLRIGLLLTPQLLALTAALLGVAAVGKLAGGFLGGRYLARMPSREALAYGVALNARGVLGIVVATLGYSMQIFGVEVYSMVVVTSVVTSVVTPVGLRRLFPKSELEAEDPSEGPRFRRVLVPVRFRPDGGRDVHDLQSGVLSAIAGDDLRVTLLTVADPGLHKTADAHLRSVTTSFPAGATVRRRIAKGAPGDVIVAEASRGYDLVAVGAPQPSGDDDHLFSDVIDEVIRLAPCPTLVFTALPGHWPPKTIMVPTGGSPASREAAELAFALAGSESRVLLFHAVDPDLTSEVAAGSTGVRMEIGQDIVNDLRTIGEEAGVSVSSEVVMGSGLTASISERARHGIDLLVLGTSVRAGSQRLFLGPKVERLLHEAPTSILVLNV